MFFERLQDSVGINASADIFNTNPASPCINMGLVREAVARFQHSGGTTGKGTIKVQACTKADGTGATDIAFDYKKAVGTGAYGEITKVAATGVETVAAQTAKFLINVRAAQMPEGKPFLRIKLDETANDPVVGCLALFGAEPEFFQGTKSPAL